MIRTLLYWLAVACLIALDRHLPHARGVLGADFGSGDAGIVATVINALGGLFRGKVSKELASALFELRKQLIDFGKAVAQFMTSSGVLLSRLTGIVRRFWRSVILPSLMRMDHWITSLHHWLRDTIKPILDFLLSVRKHILDFYAKWFRPIFDTIEVFRRILQLGSFLGIDAARKLDQKLAELERRLRVPIDFLVRKVNEAIGWVNRIVDANGFFQRYTLLRSQALYVYDTFAILHKARQRPLTEEERKAITWAAEVRPADETFALMDQAVRGEAWVLMSPAERDAMNTTVFGGPIP
jgi:hypothetical protein